MADAPTRLLVVRASAPVPGDAVGTPFLDAGSPIGRAASHRTPARSRPTAHCTAEPLGPPPAGQAGGPVRRIVPDGPEVPRRAQRLSVKVKSPESLPLSRTAETRLPSVISRPTSARERPHPSAISRTGRTGIRAAKRTETSITS
ncbi:hypothetical protein QF030_007739 [Streptomyces rishiriensis]|uniref:Uncharacterized protein n=1 Tax=Streptomyces rishiriensis TaxID=68264 RepID=A0ABU0P2D6_STRRH|nr:hypothetical protein [Streptomyces rishiriensis]